jgi:hypothetical protein
MLWTSVVAMVFADHSFRFIDLIERYAKTEGLELKDVVNLAWHEFFERRDYLPQNAKGAGES